MRIFKDLWWYFKREKKSYLLGIMVLMFVSLFELIPPYVIGVMVDGMKQQTLTSGEILKWMLLLLGIGVVTYILRYLWRILLFGASTRLGRLLRNQLFYHFTRMSPRFYHKRRTGDLMAHATNDVQAVEATAGEGVLTLVDSLMMGGLVILMMAIIDWKLTLIALAPMPFMAWTTSWYGSMLHKRFHKAQEAFAVLNGKVQENVTGVRVVKAFGLEEQEKRSFARLTEDTVNKNIAVARIDALFDPTIALIVAISYFLTIAFGSVNIANGTMSIGLLTTFSIYLGRLIWPMLAFGMLFNIVERGRASYDRIRKLLQVETEITDRPGASTETPKGDLTLQIDSFTYPDKKAPTLQGIRVNLKQGQTLGIVGKTGSGKTTLLKLLLREFDCHDNGILIGGKPITAYTLDALRSAIGYVPQDHVLFSATIAENIAFGKPHATREEIEEAAKIACIHEDIMHFPEGYETVVGERGVTLSGGQKQRISIARALLLNPEILILDDSLSAVDAKTEQIIFEALKENRKGKTTIVSAHRLSAVEHAEQIIVLDEGKIIEQGTHNQLLELDGWYAMMYHRQQLESLVAQGGGIHGDA